MGKTVPRRAARIMDLANRESSAVVTTISTPGAVSAIWALFGAEGLNRLDTQASTGRANRREESNDRHDYGRYRQQRAAEGAEHLAFARPIDHKRQHGADHDACRELQRRPRE